MSDSSDYDYFINKRTDKLYLSKAISQTQLQINNPIGIQETERNIRVACKIIDCAESHEFIKEGKEICLRVTDGQKQQIVAKFYEDTRDICTLQIQKYSSDTGIPHKTYFTFINDEIHKLYSFIKNIAILPIVSNNSQQFLDNSLERVSLSKEEAFRKISEDPDLLDEIIKNNISKAEIIGLRFRKEQLEVFYELLNDSQKFAKYKELNKIDKDESVWQQFFEKNTWIFGYGLNFTFNSPLPERKLEQVVSGFNTFSKGKRTDALMHTKGLISSLCFGEIKIHSTPLLGPQYRPESYSISTELAGSIAQVHKTIHKSLKDLTSRLDLKDDKGNPIGQTVFLCQPKAFLIIGCLKEFKAEHGINEDKYSSFELFRRNINNPEIITFDELYERARCIVELSDVKE